jgi:serine/threonine-protein kinase
MEIVLTVTAGPHAGQSFRFSGHDRFLVGRSPRAHFRLRPREGEVKDRRVSRFHFLVEVNPPLCRLLDANSRNGTFVNGKKVTSCDLHDGDEIQAGHTRISVSCRQDVRVPTVLENEVFELAGPPQDVRVPTALEKAFELAVPQQTTPPLPPGSLCPACQSSLPGPGPLCRSCLQAAQAQPQPVPGYLLVRELGRGGMGAVHLALRRADNALVAIKMVVPAGLALPATAARFLREAGILRTLTHPHVVHFHESGQAGNTLFFVMDFVSGTDAARLLRQQVRLRVSVAVRLVCQLLEALEYAHAQGFVHRDVKPANLLIEVNGRGKTVKVADFGLARVYEASQMSGLTLQNEFGGTLGFMPPEQLTHFREARPAADQYSAAATLYNLITGEVVYDFPRDAAGQIDAILNTDPVPIQSRLPSLNGDLSKLIHRALARDPDRRFPDVSAFRRALKPFGRERPG